MQRRFVSIWFRQLLADWQLIRRPELSVVPFVFAAPDHGRIMITAVSPLAAESGVEPGMRAADAKAICPGLEVLDDKPGRPLNLLRGLGEWCVRYSPIVAIDEFGMDGLLLDISGCEHLWCGEREDLKEMVSRLKSKGYTVRVAIADTPGAARAVSRFGIVTPLIPVGGHPEALLSDSFGSSPVILFLDDYIGGYIFKFTFINIMTTLEITIEINKMNVESSDDFDSLERIDELTDFLKINSDGYLACEHLIYLLERHPNVEFGTPGEPVHTLEDFQGHYEAFLYQSLERQPNQMTVWMLNRIINAETNAEQKNELLNRLKNCLNHPSANDITKQSILTFLKYQTEE